MLVAEQYSKSKCSWYLRSQIKVGNLSGVNLQNWLHIPRNQQSSVIFIGSFIHWIASTLSGSGHTPDWSMSCPKNLILYLKNWHLSLFKALCKRSKTAISHWSCSCWVLPCTRTSSITHRIPGKPLRILDICFWKYSDTEVIPKEACWIETCRMAW